MDREASHRRVKRRRRDLGRSAAAAEAARREARARPPVAVPGPQGSLRREAQAYAWLLDQRRGMKVADIARAAGVTVGRVKNEIYRARLNEPAPEPVSPYDLVVESRAIPLFPVGVLTPTSACPHFGPIPAGSRFYCVVCDAAGFDHLEAPSGGPAPGRSVDRDPSGAPPSLRASA